MCKRTIFSLITFIFLSTHSLTAWDMEDYGDMGQYALPISAVALALLNQDYKGSVKFGEEFSLTMGVVFVLKPLINDKRPNLGKWSFPSGHTASAFTGAAFLQHRYGWKYGIPAYVAAAMVGYSRVNAKKHWVQDVCAGATIAVASNLLLNGPCEGLLVTPYYDGHAGGCCLQFRW